MDDELLGGALPDCIKLLSIDGDILRVNAAGRLMVEAAGGGDVIGNSYAQMWPRDERSKIEDAIRDAAQGRPARMRGFSAATLGAPRLWEVSFEALGAGIGRDAVILSIARDLSASSSATGEMPEPHGESAERAASARTREALTLAPTRMRTWKLSPDVIGALNRDGYFEASNPAWESVLGWSESEVAATSIFDLLHPDDVERTRAGFELTLQGHPALYFPNRFRHKDGSYRWMSWVAVLEEGLIYCTGRDITREKEQARRLELSREERDRAWRLSQDLLVAVDVEGSRIVEVNAAWLSLLGWTEDELVGRSLADFAHQDDLSAINGIFAGLVAAPLVEPFECRVRHKDGSYHWFAWTGALEGETIYASARPTTLIREKEAALRGAEQALRQAQKMEAVGQLTGGLAHDFNNLLAGIAGSLEMLSRHSAAGRASEAERYLGFALSATQRAAALTQRLLAFSRPQALELKARSVERLIAGMEDLIRRTIGPAVALEVGLASELWPIFIDESQFENALLNLCLNARDAMPGGGALTIRAENRSVRHGEVGDIEAGAYVLLSVADTGSGMPPEVLSKAFDPFFTTKALGKGTGLGLSMVYGFAKESGGHVRISSEDGKGARVELYLPRGPEPVAEEEEPASIDMGARLAASGHTVLVVEDDPTIRLVTVELMQELGYQALSAHDGASALAILDTDARIDLLLCDVGLPRGISGRQVAAAARGSRPTLKVLFVTGYGEAEVLGAAPVDPGTQAMSKPFELSALARRVKSLLDEDPEAHGEGA